MVCCGRDAAVALDALSDPLSSNLRNQDLSRAYMLEKIGAHITGRVCKHAWGMIPVLLCERPATFKPARLARKAITLVKHSTVPSISATDLLKLVFLFMVP